MYKKPVLIAEVGCNHQGDIEIAKEYIRTANYFCKIGHIKFQKRNPKEVLSKEQYYAPHPNPINSFGETYGEHREKLEFNISQHRELRDVCDELCIQYSSSVWDLTSAKEITSLEPSFIKIPSACNNNYEMLDYICKNYKGEIHISLGMTTKLEEADLVNFFVEKRRNEDLVLYSCTSGYPVPYKDVCLLEISRLQKLYKNKVKAIGFSGHHNGFAIDISAYTLGAQYLERHFTLDRTWKGTDHSASLEPDGLRRLNRNLEATYESLTYKQTDLLNIEIPQRYKLKRG